MKYFMIATMGATLIATSANACLDFIPRGARSDTSLFAKFENNCSYTVIAKTRTSDGYKSLVGPLKPTESELFVSHTNTYRVNYTWSNWDETSDSPPDPQWPN